MLRRRFARSSVNRRICGIFAKAARSAALMRCRYIGIIHGRRSGVRWSFYRSFEFFMCPLQENTEISVNVTNLVKRYKKGVEANLGIYFDAQKCEVIAILGPNG